MESVLPANVKEIFVRPKFAHPTVCRTNTLFSCKKFVPFAKAARDGRQTLRLPQHVGKTRLFQFFVVADYRV